MSGIIGIFKSLERYAVHCRRRSENKIFDGQKAVVISCKYAKIGVGGAEQRLSSDEKGIYIKDGNGKQRPVTADEAINLVLDTWLRGGFSYEL